MLTYFINWLNGTNIRRVRPFEVRWSEQTKARVAIEEFAIRYDTDPGDYEPIFKLLGGEYQYVGFRPIACRNSLSSKRFPDLVRI